MKNLRERVAVVTGAASGIGRATALALARRGCDVALVDLDAAGLASAAGEVERAGRRASSHLADVADAERMHALAGEVQAEHGRVHVLVNNAGVSVGGTLEEQSLEDLRWIVGVNLWGVVHGCKFFLPLLRREDEAHVVNVSSMFGLMGVPTQSSYCATKFAVRGLSEALAAELSGTRIGVTCVHPGGVRTNIVRNSRTHDEAVRARTIALFERFATAPERVGEAIARAIERNRSRLVICREAHLADWAKRLFPIAAGRAVGWGYRRRGGLA
jgi:NAD(P)-dependent dehydrogenase (short-subunit alcohol dehydrogenase family)